MKEVLLRVKDDSKLKLLIDFLKEISFVEIENMPKEKKAVNRKYSLPESILNPMTAEDFKIYSRDELNER